MMDPTTIIIAAGLILVFGFGMFILGALWAMRPIARTIKDFDSAVYEDLGGNPIPNRELS